jgi:hypothetical protein
VKYLQIHKIFKNWEESNENSKPILNLFQIDDIKTDIVGVNSTTIRNGSKYNSNGDDELNEECMNGCVWFTNSHRLTCLEKILSFYFGNYSDFLQAFDGI